MVNYKKEVLAVFVTKIKMINIAWNQFKTIFDARSTRTFFVTTEAVTRMCSVKEMLLKISKN